MKKMSSFRSWWIYVFAIFALIVAGLIFVVVATWPAYPKSQIINGQATNYTFAYDGRTRSPAWIFELMQPSQALETNSVKSFPYYEDKLVPSTMRASQQDYESNGFTMASLAMNPSYRENHFPLSVTSPQLIQFNRGYWLKFENYLRERINKIATYQVVIITGPLYLPQERDSAKLYVTYEVIGEDNIAIPTHFFRALFFPINGNTEEIAPFTVGAEIYVLPNENIPEETPLESFKISREHLEKISGIALPSDKKIEINFTRPFPIGPRF